MRKRLRLLSRRRAQSSSSSIDCGHRRGRSPDKKPVHPVRVVILADFGYQEDGRFVPLLPPYREKNKRFLTRPVNGKKRNKRHDDTYISLYEAGIF